MSVCGGAYTEVCVYRSDVKGRNRDSNYSFLVGEMLNRSMACGISPKKSSVSFASCLGVIREKVHWPYAGDPVLLRCHHLPKL